MPPNPPMKRTAVCMCGHNARQHGDRELLRDGRVVARALGGGKCHACGCTQFVFSFNIKETPP